MKYNIFQRVRFHRLGMLCLFFIGAVLPSHLYADGWEAVPLNKQGVPEGAFHAVTYGNDRFVAVGDNGLLWTSPSPIPGGPGWSTNIKTIKNNNTSTSPSLYGITYGQGKYVAVGKHGIIMTSSDGTTWTLRNSSNGANLLCVAYNGKDLFVAAGYNCRVMTSQDDIKWTDIDKTKTPPSSQENPNVINAIAWGNNVFVAGLDAGLIYTSTNGVRWKKAPINTGSNNTSVIYGGDLFVVGGHATIYTSPASPDGVNDWKPGNPNTKNYFHGLTYTGRDYIGCGNSDGYGCSMIQVTTTATGTWKRDYTPTDKVLAGITNNGTNVIAVGAEKTIITNKVACVGDGKGCGSGGTTTTSRKSMKNMKRDEARLSLSR